MRVAALERSQMSAARLASIARATELSSLLSEESNLQRRVRILDQKLRAVQQYRQEQEDEKTETADLINQHEVEKLEDERELISLEETALKLRSKYNISINRNRLVENDLLQYHLLQNQLRSKAQGLSQALSSISAHLTTVQNQFTALYNAATNVNDKLKKFRIKLADVKVSIARAETSVLTSSLELLDTSNETSRLTTVALNALRNRSAVVKEVEALKREIQSDLDLERNLEDGIDQFREEQDKYSDQTTEITTKKVCTISQERSYTVQITNH